MRSCYDYKSIIRLKLPNTFRQVQTASLKWSDMLKVFLWRGLTIEQFAIIFPTSCAFMRKSLSSTVRLPLESVCFERKDYPWNQQGRWLDLTTFCLLFKCKTTSMERPALRHSGDQEFLKYHCHLQSNDHSSQALDLHVSWTWLEFMIIVRNIYKYSRIFLERI